MNKLKKTLLLEFIFGVLGIIGFIKNIPALSIVSLIIFSGAIFFYNPRKITIGLVKLFCISILFLLFFTIGKHSFGINKSVMISSLLWICLNVIGIYIVLKSETKVIDKK